MFGVDAISLFYPQVHNELKVELTTYKSEAVINIGLFKALTSYIIQSKLPELENLDMDVETH